MSTNRPGERGFTLLELVITCAILALLAASAFPLFEVSIRREREVELRHSLRTIRRALDAFHESYVASGGPTATNPGGIPSAQGGGGQPGLPGTASNTNQAPFGATAGIRNRAQGQKPREVELIDVSQFYFEDSKGYPPNLKILVEGVQRSGGFTDDFVYFLRRVPRDPMRAANESDDSDPNYGWGARAYQDSPESRSWGGRNVYDVYSKSTAKPLDGRGTYRDW